MHGLVWYGACQSTERSWVQTPLLPPGYILQSYQRCLNCRLRSRYSSTEDETAVKLILIHSRIHSICIFIHSRIHSICIFIHSVIHSICIFIHSVIHLINMHIHSFAHSFNMHIHSFARSSNININSFSNSINMNIHSFVHSFNMRWRKCDVYCLAINTSVDRVLFQLNHQAIVLYLFKI